MAEAFREVTEWGDDTPNHIYLFDGDKALGYMRFGEDEPFYFSKPMQIDKRRRKFELLKNNPFKVEKKSSVVKVEGSKGNVYFVNTEEKTCTCPGFTFRGKCKHVESTK
jgi:hypothetical protein